MDDPQRLREQDWNRRNGERDDGLGIAQPSRELVPTEEPKLPVPLPPKPTPWVRRWRRSLILLVLLAIGSAGAVIYWLKFSQPALPPGIVFGNGRLEADQINIDTKYAGRIAELFVDEGDMVTAGQVLARMDTRDLAASLKKAQAQVKQAERAVDEANSNVAQQQSQVLLSQQEFDRATYLVQKGFQTKEVLDQRQQQLNGASWLLNALKARVIQLEHALEAARHDVELYTVEIDDNTLVAPRDGRIQYRVANVGEVLPAGGHVFAMLDTSNVYMDIYLPTTQAGRVKFGAEARIVLDAYPKVAIPAKAVFIASQAQFTPKAVETQSEREKLMFRIRVQIDPDRLRTRAERVRSGLPGVAYVLIDPTTKWPDWLQRTPP
jgi:HlyD family secretion protein